MSNDPRLPGLSPELSNNTGQDSMARAFGALSGIGLLLSAVMPWASLGSGNGLLPSAMGINQLFAGFGQNKGWWSMAIPLVIAGLSMLAGSLFRGRQAGNAMFGRVTSGGSGWGRRAFYTLGALLAVVTTVLWTIQTGQHRINDGYDFMAGNVQYGGWIGIASAAASAVGMLMSYFGAAKSVKARKVPTSSGFGAPPATHA